MSSLETEAFPFILMMIITERERERETEAIEKSNEVCKQRAKMVSRKNGFEGEKREREREKEK